MTNLIAIINILAIVGVVVYLTQNSNKDKIDTIREVTKALLAKSVTEYTEVIPEQNEEELVEPDVLEDVDTVDETLLIKQLNKEYEDIKN